MKKLFLVSIFLFSQALIMAHPASTIDAKFDSKESILKVTMQHESKDITKHYIENIEILVNGKKAVTQLFLSQTDGKEQVAQYKIIDAKKGSEIKVSGECNKGGTKTVTIKVE